MHRQTRQYEYAANQMRIQTMTKNHQAPRRAPITTTILPAMPSMSACQEQASWT